MYVKQRNSTQISYPKPWLLSRALLGSHEENQPVYWSWLEQVI